jgi:ribosomal protein L17
MFISQAKLNRLKRLEGKTNKKGQPLAISNFAESVIELDNIMQQITITKRKEITKAAEPIALAAYRNHVEISTKAHKFYVKGKGLKYNIMPGNLRRSIQIVSDVKNFKYLTSAIGPLYKDAGSGVTLSSEAKADGFYAHMIYGSTKAWVKRVKNLAERASQMAVINKMSGEALKMAKQYPRKFWEL